MVQFIDFVKPEPQSENLKCDATAGSTITKDTDTKEEKKVPSRSLLAGELCSKLALRGLPAWLLEYFSNGLAKRDLQPLRHDSITCEDLASMGIVHPLHQRRLLREIEGLICGTIRVDEGANERLVSKSPMPSKAKIKLASVQEDNKVEDGPPQVVLNHARRRFLAAEGFSKHRVADLPPHVAALLTVRGSLSHRHTEPESTVRIIPEIAQPPRMRAFSEHQADESGEKQCDIEFEASELGWDEWLQARLHSWGPLAIISRLLTVAQQGDLIQLRDMKEAVQVHGDAFLESLSCTPLPQQVLSRAPSGTDQPKDIWNWILWRLKGLEEADVEIVDILSAADAIMASVTYNPLKKRDKEPKIAKVQKKKSGRQPTAKLSNSQQPLESPKSARSASSQLFDENSEATESSIQSRKIGTGLGRLAKGTTSETLAVDQDAPQDKKMQEVTHRTPRPDLLEPQEKKTEQVTQRTPRPDRPGPQWKKMVEVTHRTPRPDLLEAQEKKLEEVTHRTPRPDLLERFRNAAKSVLAHVKAANGNCFRLNTNLQAIISLQCRLRTIAHEIKATQKRLGHWPGLTADAHEACRAKLLLLKNASEQLFFRFVEVKKPLEESLRLATLGEQGHINVADLEKKIMAMQKEMAARVIIGEYGWRAAKEAGVSLTEYGFEEAPDPWGGEVHPSPPPWEGTFTRAIKRFEPLRKERATRRKAQTNVSTLASLFRLKASRC